jgi:nucleoid DNA-binding protein
MKFSEIKHKIKNLGNFKSLEEIKKAGLRIVKNTKTGDYWLIEEEFLKPVVKSPRECKTILIKPEDLKYKVLMVHKSKEELKGKKILDYIEWGEKQGFHKRPTCKSRKWWWGLEQYASEFLWWVNIGDRYVLFWNKGKLVSDKMFYHIYTKIKDPLCFVISLNCTLTRLNAEIYGQEMTGAITVLTHTVEMMKKIKVVHPDFLDITRCQKLDLLRDIQNCFTELGFDPNKPIREQEPNPLPDRKALDDIVFDALGLTEEERKEVYWAVAELVQNRLKKAKSV